MSEHRRHSYVRTLLMAAILLALIPSIVLAAWRVIPIRLEFTPHSRSGVITLVNDGDAPINFSVEAMEWTQDAAGEDVYTATDDLVYFPKQLGIEPGSERILRAGIRVPALDREKTYRLFIREAADPRDPQGTAVVIAIKFGVPIFVTPSQEEIEGELRDLSVENGEARFTLANTGNVHFRVGTHRLIGKNDAGEEVFHEELKGWYLLDGANREHTVPIDPQICPQLEILEVQMNADRLFLTSEIEVDPASCAGSR